MEENKPIQAAEAKDSKNESSKEDYFANLSYSDLGLSMETMIKKGVHFGHQKSRRNPDDQNQHWSKLLPKDYNIVTYFDIHL